MYLFIYLFIYVFIYLSIYLFIYLFIYLSIYLFIYLFIHLFIFIGFWQGNLWWTSGWNGIPYIQTKPYIMIYLPNVVVFQVLWCRTGNNPNDWMRIISTSYGIGSGWFFLVHQAGIFPEPHAMTSLSCATLPRPSMSCIKRFRDWFLGSHCQGEATIYWFYAQYLPTLIDWIQTTTTVLLTYYDSKPAGPLWDCLKLWSSLPWFNSSFPSFIPPYMEVS